jgi:hypothetical protein
MEQTPNKVTCRTVKTSSRLIIIKIHIYKVCTSLCTKDVDANNKLCPHSESTGHENALLVLLMHFSVLCSLKETSLDDFVQLGTYLSQIREQMPCPDLHVFTLKFLALKKKLGFPP